MSKTSNLATILSLLDGLRSAISRDPGPLVRVCDRVLGLLGGSYFDGHRLGGDEPLGPGGSPTPPTASSAWGRVNAPA